MGAWGAGLYQNDFALDLRPVITAIARLPFETEHVVKLLRDEFSNVADNPADEDHTIFWLVLADQCARRNVDSAVVRERAFAIIDEGTDLQMHRALGMTERDLGKRATMLDALRQRIAVPPDGTKPRVI